MDQTLRSHAASTEFWDGYTQWHKLWMEHNNYHERIVEVLSSMVKPDWRILDIGAGNGMLSLPLCAMGFLSTGYSKKDTDFSTKRKWT